LGKGKGSWTEGGTKMKGYTTKRYPDARDIRKSTKLKRIVDLA